MILKIFNLLKKFLITIVCIIGCICVTIAIPKIVDKNKLCKCGSKSDTDSKASTSLPTASVISVIEENKSITIVEQRQIDESINKDNELKKIDSSLVLSNNSKDINMHEQNISEKSANEVKPCNKAKKVKQPHMILTKEAELTNLICYNKLKPYKKKGKDKIYIGVQPYENLLLDNNNGCKGYSTPIIILEKNESIPKLLAFAFKPTENKHDIFESYRKCIEEKDIYQERDLAPFTLIDLNGTNLIDKVYYGIPRELEQNVKDKNKLNLCDSYDVTYYKNEKVKWYFYEKDNSQQLCDRNTIALISINDNRAKHRKHVKNQYHKLPLGKSLPNKFIRLLKKHSIY